SDQHTTNEPSLKPVTRGEFWLLAPVATENSAPVPPAEVPRRATTSFEFAGSRQHATKFPPPSPETSGTPSQPVLVVSPNSLAMGLPLVPLKTRAEMCEFSSTQTITKFPSASAAARPADWLPVAVALARRGVPTVPLASTIVYLMSLSVPLKSTYVTAKRPP